MHWHPPEAEDLDVAPCDDEHCRHEGARFRHSIHCPANADDACNYGLRHTVSCICARCYPAGVAIAPRWNEQPNAYTFTRAQLRADAAAGRGGVDALSARERFAQMQGEKRERESVPVSDVSFRW